MITIRQLQAHEWPLYKEIRLRALQSDPGVFGSNYAREAAFGAQDWQDRLAGPDTAVFILCDDETIIGVTGIGVDRDDAARKDAILWGSWIAPTHRGRGLSDMLYAARLDWARRHATVTRVLSGHRESNLPSKRANRRNGLTFLRAEDRLWPDGVTEKDLIYGLELEKAGAS